MERSRTVLWYEDLECHRQPSLYYLSSEDDPAGPHLICDWNGAPTDLGELEIDLMAKLVEAKTEELENESRMLQINDPLDDDCDSQMQEAIVPRSISSHTTLTENDGSQLNFLTVPPHVQALAKRLINCQSQPPNRHPPVSEAAAERVPIKHESSPITDSTMSITQIGAASKLKTTTNLSKCANHAASPPKKARMKPLKDNFKKEIGSESNKGSKNTCKVPNQERKFNEHLDQTDTGHNNKQDSSKHSKQINHQQLANNHLHQSQKKFEHEHESSHLESPMIIIDD